MNLIRNLTLALLLLVGTMAAPTVMAAGVPPVGGPAPLCGSYTLVECAAYYLFYWDPALLPWVLETVEDALPPVLP